MYTRSLRKVFLSIKGVYFQADVCGETITWLVPYMFTQAVRPVTTERPQFIDPIRLKGSYRCRYSGNAHISGALPNASRICFL